MSQLILTEQSSSPDTPSSGKGKLYVKTDGKFYSKNDAGTEKELGASGIQESIVDAAGDIIVATANDTVTNLATPTLSAGDGDAVLTVEDTDDTTVVWKTRIPNDILLNYINAATYTIDYDDDHTLVGVYATSDMVFTFPDPTHFPTTGRGRKFLFKNGDTTGKILTVKLYGSGTFQNGLNELKVYNRGTLKMAMVRPNIADGALLLQSYDVTLQIRRNTTWASTNFSSSTAIPFDTNDYIFDENALNHSTSTNTTRVDMSVKGNFKVTFWAGINSTGGSSYAIAGYIRKNGTDTVAGSNFAFGNYQTEDTHICIGPILVESDGDDYFEVMIDQNSLTGNLFDAVIYCEASL